MPPKSLSVIIPAFNEEKNIRAACVEVSRVIEKHISDYELLVFDDASQDRTADVVKEIQKGNSRIKLFQNLVNKGLGYNYRAGISTAKCEYAIMVPGDNELVADSLEGILEEIGTTDVIICYSLNPEARPYWRQLISNVFTASLNFLFGLKVRYYNGPSVIRTELAREFAPFTSSFAYMAVILVQLIKGSASYKHVGFRLRHRPHGRTKAFRLKNIASVIKDVLALFWKVMVLRNLKPILAVQPEVSKDHTVGIAP